MVLVYTEVDIVHIFLQTAAIFVLSVATAVRISDGVSTCYRSLLAYLLSKGVLCPLFLSRPVVPTEATKSPSCASRVESNAFVIRALFERECFLLLFQMPMVIFDYRK